jgi:hypothetical protein
VLQTVALRYEELHLIVEWGLSHNGRTDRSRWLVGRRGDFRSWGYFSITEGTKPRTRVLHVRIRDSEGML